MTIPDQKPAINDEPFCWPTICHGSSANSQTWAHANHPFLVLRSCSHLRLAPVNHLVYLLAKCITATALQWDQASLYMATLRTHTHAHYRHVTVVINNKGMLVIINHHWSHDHIIWLTWPAMLWFGQGSGRWQPLSSQVGWWFSLLFELLLVLPWNSSRYSVIPMILGAPLGATIFVIARIAHVA